MRPVPTDAAYYTPGEFADRLRVKVDSVLAWIASGELKALDVSSRPGVGRPRWRIDAEAVKAWEQRRTKQPPVKTTRRQREQLPEDFIRYFSS